MDLKFGETIFDEEEVQRAFAKFTGKWVVQLKAVGLLENKNKFNDFVLWYEDKTDITILNSIINSNEDSREVYVLLDNLEQVTYAYEHWFPLESELMDDERYLFVKFSAVSPPNSDRKYFITNEKSN